MLERMFDLTGRTAVVIGGGGGIGGACARGFAAFGAQVAVVDTNLEAAERVAAELRADGKKAQAWVGDVTDLEGTVRLAEQIEREFGAPEILLNSVGATVRKPLMETTPEEWERVIRVNLTSAYILSRAFGESMIRNRRGKVIHIASTGGLRAGANFCVYGASKAGLIHFVKSLALEWAPYKICVNAIAPTATETGFTEDYYKANPDIKERVIKNHPFGRLGVPDDYVGAAVYLASPASDFVTGETIVVDSGKSV